MIDMNATILTLKEKHGFDGSHTPNLQRIKGLSHEMFSQCISIRNEGVSLWLLAEGNTVIQSL